MATPAAYIAFTAPINPTGATPVLTIDQVWIGLGRKVRNAGEFVGGAIRSTTVISEDKDEFGREVITRDVVFEEGSRKAREVCTFFPQMKVEFLQTDGTRVLNTIGDGADGQLYMTYQFEWLMAKDTPLETQQENTLKWKKMAAMAVQSSIDKIRTLVKEGSIEA